MAGANDPPGGFPLILTEEERAQLLNWLEQRLRTTLVEEHRTKTADCRKYIISQEEILEKVIHKLRKRLE